MPSQSKRERGPDILLPREGILKTTMQNEKDISTSCGSCTSVRARGMAGGDTAPSWVVLRRRYRPRRLWPPPCLPASTCARHRGRGRPTTARPCSPPTLSRAAAAELRPPRLPVSATPLAIIAIAAKDPGPSPMASAGMHCSPMLVARSSSTRSNRTTGHACFVGETAEMGRSLAHIADGSSVAGSVEHRNTCACGAKEAKTRFLRTGRPVGRPVRDRSTEKRPWLQRMPQQWTGGGAEFQASAVIKPSCRTRPRQHDQTPVC